MPLEIRVRDPKKFFNDAIKAVMPKGSKITIGVDDRPHYKRMDVVAPHTKGVKGVFTSLGITSSQIAAAHEFGIGVPRRSFMRDTMTLFLFKDAMKLAEKKYKRVDFYLKALSKQVYDRVQEAFDTNGFGRWKPLSEKYMAETGRTSPALTDTGQMRGAIFVSYAGETLSGKQISGVAVKPKRKDYGVSRKKNDYLYQLYGDPVAYFHKGGK